ncbi:hypothetical protein GALL_43530 [mine drainage metagenome]|uniref:Uncharacterized protein n=1 Tax=mine drainage metagenome TaxID=410659 RepID=A0A1J5TEF6_9ZZZZ
MMVAQQELHTSLCNDVQLDTSLIGYSLHSDSSCDAKRHRYFFGVQDILTCTVHWNEGVSFSEDVNKFVMLFRREIEKWIKF